MTATEILSELHRRGVELIAAGDRLRFRPKEAVTPELVTTLARHKTEILAALKSGRSATGYSKCPGPEKCAGCYAVKPGVYLHPPKPSQGWLEWLAKWQPRSERTQ